MSRVPATPPADPPHPAAAPAPAGTAVLPDPQERNAPGPRDRNPAGTREHGAPEPHGHKAPVPCDRNRTPGPRERHRAPGLRERKKTRTRAAIRSAAFALIERHGYEHTTIEQIAEHAEVSPSTVLRYFPSKEDIVLPDPHGAVLLGLVRARPADEPWQLTVGHVLRQALDLAGTDPVTARVRARLTQEVPAVRSRLTGALAATAREVAEAVASRAGRAPDDLEIRVHTVAVLSGLAEAYCWWAEHGMTDDLTALLDRAARTLVSALPPAPAPGPAGPGATETAGPGGPGTGASRASEAAGPGGSGTPVPDGSGAAGSDGSGAAVPDA